MKKIVLKSLIISFFWGSYNPTLTTPLFQKNDTHIAFRAPNRLSCSTLTITFKKDLPADKSMIYAIGFKYNPSNKQKDLTQTGSCPLSKFPRNGIKFDSPSWNKKIHYQIRFVLKENLTSEPIQFLPIDDIVENISSTPATWCPLVQTPYGPLNLRTRLTKGEQTTLASTLALASIGFVAHWYKTKQAKEAREKQNALLAKRRKEKKEKEEARGKHRQEMKRQKEQEYRQTLKNTYDEDKEIWAIWAKRATPQERDKMLEEAKLNLNKVLAIKDNPYRENDTPSWHQLEAEKYQAKIDAIEEVQNNNQNQETPEIQKPLFNASSG